VSKKQIPNLNQKVKQTSLICFLYTWNKENSYKLKQEVFLDQCCLHLAKWSIWIQKYFISPKTQH